MSRPKIFPFQLKLRVNECHFGFPQLWAVIHLTLSIDLMHWRHKGSRLHNNGARLVSRSAHVLCWQCALALSLSVRGPGRASPAVWQCRGCPPWLHAWRWRTWQCLVWPPTQLGALLWRHMHMVYAHCKQWVSGVRNAHWVNCIPRQVLPEDTLDQGRRQGILIGGAEYIFWWE